MYQRKGPGKSLLDMMRDQAWGFVFGFLSLVVALASCIVAVPRAAPIRNAISQVISGMPVPALTPTQLPPLASAETLSENIVLKCNDCNDPLVVTITSIKIEPQNNRMIWSITLVNNSQGSIDGAIYPFQLQNPLDDNSFIATGDHFNDYTCQIPLMNAADAETTTATFSFIPYTKVQYTLSGTICEAGVPFLSVPLTFP